MSEDKKYDPQDKFGWPEGPDMMVYYDDAGNRISAREWMIKIGLEVPPLDTERDTEPGDREEYDDRAALTGILFVLKSGTPWEMLPQEMGCGSGMTCWRRLKEWHEAGVWEELHRVLLDRLGKADEIDWERASLDSASVAAPGGAKRPVRIRRTRAKRAQSAMLFATGREYRSQ